MDNIVLRPHVSAGISLHWSMRPLIGSLQSSQKTNYVPLHLISNVNFSFLSLNESWTCWKTNFRQHITTVKGQTKCYQVFLCFCFVNSFHNVKMKKPSACPERNQMTIFSNHICSKECEQWFFINLWYIIWTVFTNWATQKGEKFYSKTGSTQSSKSYLIVGRGKTNKQKQTAPTVQSSDDHNRFNSLTNTWTSIIYLKKASISFLIHLEEKPSRTKGWKADLKSTYVWSWRFKIK